ncbi:MAG: hypothetical protein IJW29_08250 [Clostridia bacterium]|nr:hypothetical protein [Clostridia bacterium]
MAKSFCNANLIVGKQEATVVPAFNNTFFILKKSAKQHLIVARKTKLAFSSGEGGLRSKTDEENLFVLHKTALLIHHYVVPLLRWRRLSKIHAFINQILYYKKLFANQKSNIP